MLAGYSLLPASPQPSQHIALLSTQKMSNETGRCHCGTRPGLSETHPELTRVHPELVQHITYYNVAVLQFSYSYPAEECLNFIGISPRVAYNEQSSTEFLPSRKKMRIKMLGTDLDRTEPIKIQFCKKLTMFENRGRDVTFFFFLL